jgi:hypothetical protein
MRVETRKTQAGTRDRAQEGEETMYIQEMTIAKSEYMAFNEQFNRLPNKGGVTMIVPNIIDRLLSAIASHLHVK